MEISSLEELLVEELRDLYNAEKQILKALPKMVKAADHHELQNAFREHVEQTQEHVRRLDQVFESLGKSARGKKCAAMEGILEEGQEMMQMDAEPDVLDAALIAAAQRVEHYEIAGYGTVRAYAEILGHDEAVDLLQQTLDEEKETDRRLTDIAMSAINIEAVNETGTGIEEEEMAPAQTSRRSSGTNGGSTKASAGRGNSGGKSKPSSRGRTGGRRR